jgi:tetratricopeptide (TPR) repeat protein
VAFDPTLSFSPQQRAGELAAEPVLREGNTLARAGHIISATQKFSDALALDPTLNINPQQRAGELAAGPLVAAATTLARAGHIITATQKFSDALALDPTLQFNPQQQAGKLAAQPLMNEGIRLAEAGNILSATQKFSTALLLAPSLDFVPSTTAQNVYALRLLEAGEAFARQGNIAQATQTYSQAQHLAATIPLTIPLASWNNLCGYGVLWEAVDDVWFACQQAAAMQPDNPALAGNRALARAQRGEYAAAASDLRVFRTWLQAEGTQAEQEQGVSMLDDWIAELEAGRNPFTPELLATLRQELGME